MKTIPKIHSLAVLFAASTLTSIGLAQLAGTPAAPSAPATPAMNSVNAGGQAQVGPLNGTNSGGNPVSATNTVNANVNAAGQPMANPNLNSTPGSAGVSGTVSGSTATGTTVPTVNANGTLNTGVNTGAATTASSSLSNAGSGSMALDSQLTSRQIRSLAYDARTDGARNVESGLDASSRFTANAGSHAGELRGESQAQLQSAVNVAREREARVRSSLRAVQTAGKDNYAAARSQLAQDYDAYATAVAQVEASSKVNATR